MFAFANAANAANAANDDDFSDSPMEEGNQVQVTPKDKKRAPRKPPQYDTKASHTITRAEAVKLFGLANYQPPAEYLKAFDRTLATRAERPVRLTVTTTFAREAEEAEQPELRGFDIHFDLDDFLHGPVRSPADLPCDENGEPIEGDAFVSVESFVDALCDLLAPFGVDREQFVKFFAVVDSSGDLSVNQITKTPVVGKRNVAVTRLTACCLCGDVIPMDAAGRRQDALTAKATFNGHKLACCAACPVQSRELTVGPTKLRLERSKKALLVSADGAILYADFTSTGPKQPAQPKQPQKQPVVVNLEDETSDEDSDSAPLVKPTPKPQAPPAPAAPAAPAAPEIKSEHSPPKRKPAPKQAAAASTAAVPKPAAAPKQVQKAPVLAEPELQKRKADHLVDHKPDEQPPHKAPRVDGLASAIASLLLVLADVPDSVRAKAVTAVAQHWPI